MGVVSAIGLDRSQFWSALAQGQHGIVPLQGPRMEGLRCPYGAQLQDYRPEDWFSRRQLEYLDPFAQYLVLAGRQALEDSALPLADSARVGVIAGTGGGGQLTLEQQYHQVYAQNRKVHPSTVPRAMANAGVSALACEAGIRGPSYVVSSACSSSNHAIGQAFWLVRQGLLDAALTGGSEAPFGQGNLLAWEGLRAVDRERCRPFSLDRNGMTLGEGGAVLVLENWGQARSRGARIYAEVVGFGMSSDAFDLTRPHADGAAAAMRAALLDAGLQPHQVDYVNAHGTGTRANDSMETQALHQVFGPHARRLAVSSTKSSHGHALGAAGALEAVASLMVLEQQLAPPTLGYRQPDPECDLDYIIEGARPLSCRVVMSNSFAFGGLNAVLLFRHPEGDE